MGTEVKAENETICERLRKLERGVFDGEVTTAVSELVREMAWNAEHGSSKPKGRVTITVDFTLDRGLMDLVADFSIKRPKRARARSAVYAGPGGELLDHDPRQMSLGLARDTAFDERPVRALG